MINRIQIPLLLNAALAADGAFPGEIEVLSDMPSAWQRHTWRYEAAGAHEFASVDPYDDLRPIIITEASLKKTDYAAWIQFLKNNPCRVTRLHIAAEKSATLKTLAIQARRVGPFKTAEHQPIPLAAHLTQQTENDTVIELPFSTILDGFSCIVVKCNTRPAVDEPVMLTIEVEALSEVRDALMSEV